MIRLEKLHYVASSQKAALQGCCAQAAVVDGVTWNSCFFVLSVPRWGLSWISFICDVSVLLLSCYKSWGLLKCFLFTNTPDIDHFYKMNNAYQNGAWCLGLFFSGWGRFGMNRRCVLSTCLVKIHQLIHSMTYPGKNLESNDLDPRSNYQLTIWDNQSTNRCILMITVPSFPLFFYR